MFDKKSDYALNKQDQDSIIYISVNGRMNITVRRSRQSGVARATCPD